MGARRRLIGRVASVATGATLLALGVSSCSSCKHDETRTEPPKPPDHLAPNEVVEGKERAFGLPLPRLVTVAARFEKTVHVYSPLTPEELVNFVHARVKDGQTVPGTSSTQLYNVVPLGDPQKRLSIDVRSFKGGDGSHSEMVVTDTTGPPLEPGLTDEQRWNKAGLTPSGELVDPKHLQ